MKKLFISLMAVLFSAYVVAADSAIARITITGTTSGGSAQITLIENPSYSAGYDNGYDAPCNINLAEDLPQTLHIYSYIGANKYSTIATNNLDGLAVDFITNLLDDEYTMTFEVFTLVAPRTLDIYDLDENQRTDIDPSESYTFNATSGHNEIKDRFIINYVPAPTPTSYTVTPNSFGYASFSAAEATVIPTGVIVYKGAINGEALDLTPVTDYVPANTGVIVAGTAGQPYEFEITSAAVADLSDNALKAYTDWASHSGTIFVLKDEALYRYTGSDFPANKAYLQISSANNAPKRISMRFNSTTAIDNVEAEAQAEKFVENGQVYIRRGNEVYNLQGQKVNF